MIVSYVGWEERVFRHQKQAQLRWLSDQTSENVSIQATVIKCQVHTLYCLYFVIHTLYYDPLRLSFGTDITAQLAALADNIPNQYLGEK